MTYVAIPYGPPHPYKSNECINLILNAKMWRLVNAVQGLLSVVASSLPVLPLFHAAGHSQLLLCEGSNLSVWYRIEFNLLPFLCFTPARMFKVLLFFELPKHVGHPEERIVIQCPSLVVKQDPQDGWRNQRSNVCDRKISLNAVPTQHQ